MGKTGICKCANPARNSPLLIMHPVIKNHLLHDLDLTLLKWCPNDHNTAPHLFSHHISDAIHYWESSQELWRIEKIPKHQKYCQSAGLAARMLSFEVSPAGLHSGTTGFLPHIILTNCKAALLEWQIRGILFHISAILWTDYLTSLSLEFSCVKWK